MIGERIGKYQVIEELGRGGMGIVYKATQVTLHRTVALKLLFPHLAGTGEYLARFRREAVTLARVPHENIVHIYDVEEYEGSPCIVMEYVSGLALTRILARERRLDPQRVRNLAVVLCGALEAAHRQGVVHRDIKPDNILLTDDGRPKLTDFGIAHMRDENVRTRTGIMLGTPHYMSPEQARGHPVTAASDLYSLGVVLYEALTGELPFQAEDSLAVALKHLNDPVPDVCEHAPWVPDPFGRVIRRLLEKDPSRRYTTASELRSALLALELAGATIPEPVRGTAARAKCPECSAHLQEDFLACPRCGLSVRQRCASCDRLYDPLSPQCPFCRTPSTPLPRALPVQPVVSVPMPAAGPKTGTPESTAAVFRDPAAPAVAGTLVPRAVENVDTGMRPAIDTSLWPVQSNTSITDPPGRTLLRVRQMRWAGFPLLAWVAAGLLAVAIGGAVATAGGRSNRGTEIAGNAIPPASSQGGYMPPAEGPLRPFDRPANTGAQNIDKAKINDILGGLLSDSTPASSPDAGQKPEAGKQPDPAAKPQPPQGGRSASGAAGSADTGQQDGASGGATTSTDSAFAEEAARKAIEDIIERQRVGTETADLDLLLSDVVEAMQDDVSRDFASMQSTTRDARSRITDIRIEFQGPTQSRAVFHSNLTAIRKRDGRRVTLFDGHLEYRLERRSERWLIAGVAEGAR